ncbi:hypothetical protein BT63DRAFT_298024 [Microthyrium microscopicum]|uniref:DUF7603 domain-containing protein n=1 Tax=Microthyrium microscopicum TaxID=703497 RepID=A0A6A6U984_9PEZI|nr:hypothetical protein BT63DRAFT_298024 [Microthyrium microscopicum]
MPTPSEDPNFFTGPESTRPFRLGTPSRPVRRPSKPPGIYPPSFSNFNGNIAAIRPQTASPATNSPIKRKPLPPGSAGHIPTKSRASSQSSAPLRSSGSSALYPPRSSSLASPITPKSRSFTLSTPSVGALDIEFVVRDLDQFPHGLTPASLNFPPTDPKPHPETIVSPLRTKPRNNIILNSNSKASRNDLPSNSTKQSLPQPPRKENNPLIRKPVRNMAASPPRQNVPLRIDLTGTDGSPQKMLPQPRSPGVALQNFFGGWKSKSDDELSPASSPGISPGFHPDHLRSTKTFPSSLDIPRANASALGIFGGPELPTPPASSSHVAALESELVSITQEVAKSLGREIEIEDELERLKGIEEEVEHLRKLVPNQDLMDSPRRTSDYFSDSGASSSRYGDSDFKVGDIGKIKRQTERQVSQMRLEMAEKMAEVHKQKRLAEDRVQLLERDFRIQSRAPSPGFSSDQVRQLEQQLDDVKRKFTEEKASNDNMQELIAGMTHEIEQYRTERDNFRDEVIPELKSKVASLELFVSEGQMYSPLGAGPADHFPEEGLASLASTQAGLSRSRSVANKRPGTTRMRSNSGNSGGQRSRAGSIKDYSMDSREQLMEKVRDMEAQREALHKALKSLLERHRWQEKQYSKRLHLLEKERDKVADMTPRRSAFHREVKTLQDEIHVLRKRADEALDQKWRCEEGLGGLKKDLDRARSETGSLRQLLQQHDIAVPSSSPQIEGEEALNKAYKELRTTHALSMVHIMSPRLGPSEDSDNVLALLKKSISDAEAERDAAQNQAEKYRDEARQFQHSELLHLSKQQSLSTNLYQSAERMDELADQVRLQIAANSKLRNRLAEAVERGEREQSSSASRIAELQGRLRGLEDNLVLAQQASDDAMSGHEEDSKRLEESRRSQLHRTLSKKSNGLRSHASSPHLAPALNSPTLFAVKSPRLDVTSSGPGLNFGEASGAQELQARVQELESALVEADREMREVVGRMNMAQMEVADLQGERDNATMQSRRLQNEIVMEREKVQALMAKA